MCTITVATLNFNLIYGGDTVIIIDLNSRTPVYEQIKEQIIGSVNAGELRPGDKLPSIRQLASELELNVNTVKRAFQELENEGVTCSHPGKGVFISEVSPKTELVWDATEKELERILNSARARGIPADRVKNLVDKVYGGNRND